jgi:hypothetical protein
MKFLSITVFDKNPKSTKPIWGLNTAAESEIQMVGEILVSVPGRNGGEPDRLLMPKTWLPQNMTRIISRQRLLQAVEFRQAVDKGLISLISAEDAERLLRQDGADEEQERLRQRARDIRQAGAARTLADSKTEIVRADGVVEEDDDVGSTKATIIDSDDAASMAKSAARGTEEAEPGISIQFKIWADRLSLSSDVLAKNDIKSRRKFSRAELSYLQRSMPRSFAKSLTMVNSTLSKMEK